MVVSYSVRVHPCICVHVCACARLPRKTPPACCCPAFFSFSGPFPSSQLLMYTSSCTYLEVWLLTWDVTHETITTIKIINTSINPQSFLLHLCSNSFLSYLPLHSPHQATTDLLSVTINYFAFSRISYQWNHIAYTFFGWGRGSGFFHLAWLFRDSSCCVYQ